MRVRRLEMVGFKSFMDRTVLVFQGGVTAVVGPNGCGKSNVADAVRWVLGEQSAKQLRGRSMEDVIFNGSESKAPLSLAEVMLTFENDRPAELPPQFRAFPEITVGRRLFRTGESEYFVNGTPVRLLDVNDLFFGSGVGRTAYSIIEQGRIGQIVSARPEDRRAIVEEAAGVTKYKKRREAAERKMEATRQNLLRVADVVQELGKQLDSLNRQARRAERYKKLKARIRELELEIASSRYLELVARRREAEGRLSSARAEGVEVGALLDAIESRAEGLRARLEEGERRLAGLADREHELLSRARVGQVSVEAAERELAQIAERTGALSAEVEGLEVQSRALAAERQAVQRERQDLISHGGSDRRRLTETEAARRELVGAESELAAQLEAARTGAAAALGRAAESRAGLAQVTRRRAERRARLERVQVEVEGLAGRAAALDQSRSAQVERLGKTRQLRLHLEAEHGAQEQVLERTRAELIQNEARLMALREEFSDRRARLDSLREVLRNYEGHGRGVRSLMTRAGQAGIFGLVADVISAPSEYEIAVEAVLGERLQYVIVESQARGVEAIDWLKSAAEGRASLVPLERLRAEDPGAPEPDRSRPGFVATCLEVARFDPRYAQVVRALLGGAVIVRDLTSALAHWQADPVRRTLVTLDGEVLDPWGVVTGGPLEGEGHGALALRREVQELEHKVRSFEAELTLAHERHRKLKARQASLEEGLRGLDRDGREKELALLDQEKDLARVGEELERAAARLGELTGERTELGEDLEALAGEEEGHRLEAAAAEAEQARHQERERETSLELERLRRRGEALEAELLDLKVKAAAGEERRQALEAALVRLEDSRREAEERRRRLGAALGGVGGRAAELGQRLEAGRSQGGELAAALALAREALQAGRAEHEAAQAAARAGDGEARDLRKRAEAVAQAAADASLTAREQALELSHLEAQVRERCQAELRHELFRFHMERPPGEAERARLEELKAQAERMGPVNLTAIEEYDELARRHQFLLGQKADLEASLSDLGSAIARINRASRQRFRDTFDRVNESFQQVFPRLFSGGRAGLVLTQVPEGEAAEAGVEIFAQPPGKKLQNVSLLSGGEKALTAVALLFAIFLIRPSPFCLLDEVDAPLDDANVGRFNDLVRELSGASQFILVTHNKRTMEMVDRLYGVTMEEPGVSTLVSVHLSGRSRSAAA